MSTGPARRGLGVVNTVMENGPADFVNCTVPPSACAPFIKRTIVRTPDNSANAIGLAVISAVNVFPCCRIKGHSGSSHHHSAHLHGLKHNPYPRDVENHG